jgi:hypothetical protein
MSGAKGLNIIQKEKKRKEKDGVSRRQDAYEQVNLGRQASSRRKGPPKDIYTTSHGVIMPQ